MVRGVRGATTAEANEKEAIVQAVQELLQRIVTVNSIAKEDVAAIIFSTTGDLNAAFPAAGARQLGWGDVPLFGTREIDCPGAPPRCIRILLLWNTEKAPREIVHVYLRGAAVLRPDWAEQNK